MKLEELLAETARTSDARFREQLEEELRTEFQIYANDLEKGLALLSGLGNLSPIVGFLGTVVGMISAFAAIASASTVNAKVVASGIQVALITTAGGLIVAAPTLAFYYLFQHVIQSLYTKIRAYYRPAVRKNCPV
jgi:biopolymer transport protein ExbB